MLLAFISLPAFSSAQNAAITASVIARVDSAGQATLTSLAIRTQPTAKAYSYTLTATKVNGSSKATSKQSGPVNLSQHLVDTLSTVRINLVEGEKLEYELLVLDDTLQAARHTGTVFADSLTIRLSPRQGQVEPRPLPASIAPRQVADKPVSEELEIDGLIINETRTKPGRDFYGYFYAGWQAPQDVSGYSITLREYPSRGRIARLGIEVDGKTIVRPILQPRQELLEQAASQAVGIVQRHLQQRRQLNAQLEDPDQAGSGLY